jgi:copper chaperone NosL
MVQSRSHVRSMSTRDTGFAALPLLLLGLLVLSVVAFVVVSNGEVTDGPKPVVWDKSPCAFCAMHVGEPRFAAQLTTKDGTTYFYDDPGCLFLHQRQLAAMDTSIHARWFHQLEGKGWLDAGAVSFRRCENTPMNYGFGAVPVGNPAAVSLQDAAAEVLRK